MKLAPTTSLASASSPAALVVFVFVFVALALLACGFFDARFTVVVFAVSALPTISSPSPLSFFPFSCLFLLGLVAFAPLVEEVAAKSGRGAAF